MTVLILHNPINTVTRILSGATNVRVHMVHNHHTISFPIECTIPEFLKKFRGCMQNCPVGHQTQRINSNPIQNVSYTFFNKHKNTQIPVGVNSGPQYGVTFIICLFGLRTPCHNSPRSTGLMVIKVECLMRRGRRAPPSSLRRIRHSTLITINPASSSNYSSSFWNY